MDGFHGATCPRWRDAHTAFVVLAVGLQTACFAPNPRFDGVSTETGTGGSAASSDTTSDSGTTSGPGTTSGLGTASASGTTSDSGSAGSTTTTTAGVDCRLDVDCDDDDPCTMEHCEAGSCVREPAGGDDDGDGVGNDCDVCSVPPYQDDLADDDGDGLPCKDDPCLFDGPTATPLPTSAGPAEELALDQIDLNQTGSTVVTVGGGDTVEVHFDYDIASCGCPGCVVQGVIGFVGDVQGPCFYEGTPGCAGVMSDVDQDIVAPQTPGMYWLAFRRDWENACATNKPFDPDQVFAAVCVQ